MEAVLHFMEREWPKIVVPVAVLLGTLFVVYLIKRVVFRVLRRWAEQTEGKFDDIIVKLLPGPVLFWTFLLGIYLAVESIVMMVGPADPVWPRVLEWTEQIALILFMVSLTYTGSRVAARLVRLRGTQDPDSIAVNSLTQNLARGAVVTVGALVTLSMMGISITPFLTALGVGGLAVALGLQDTLSNLFAGFWVSVARQVRLGDYIKLDTGQEGFVVDVSWRTTSIRMLANNLVIVPNAKLAQAIIINYNLPEKHMAVSVSVRVTHGNEPDRVERILTEVGKQAAKEIPGLLSDPAPSGRFSPGFMDTGLEFTLGCQVANFVDQYHVQSELRKRILHRLNEEGIELAQAARPPKPGGPPPK
jgi:small-conductance mechanosensitive channel